MDIYENLQGILATLPAKPGYYIYHNVEGTIIYVGKAISLKNRVRSYFHLDSSHDAKTHLIKKHLPKYNIRLKDVCLFYGSREFTAYFDDRN